MNSTSILARASRGCVRTARFGAALRSIQSWSGWSPPPGAGIGHTGYGTEPQVLRATTILSVRKDGKVAVVGDGQVSMGSMVVKPNARKVRRIGDGNVIVGFAGGTADALTLMERLESKLETYSNQLLRACVEMAKDWRTEKYLRKLEATMIVCDKHVSLEVTGNGDVLSPPDGVIAVGSGGAYARAAAAALMTTDLPAMEIAERSMKIAADMCVYTNHNFIREEMDAEEAPEGVDLGQEQDSWTSARGGGGGGGGGERGRDTDESDSDSEEEGRK